MSNSQPKPSHPPPSPQRLLRCRVRVSTEAGTVHEYVALAASTFDAVRDAMALFGHCKISASALYPAAWHSASRHPLGSLA